MPVSSDVSMTAVWQTCAAAPPARAASTARRASPRHRPLRGGVVGEWRVIMTGSLLEGPSFTVEASPRLLQRKSGTAPERDCSSAPASDYDRERESTGSVAERHHASHPGQQSCALVLSTLRG